MRSTIERQGDRLWYLICQMGGMSFSKNVVAPTFERACEIAKWPKDHVEVLNNIPVDGAPWRELKKAIR